LVLNLVTSTPQWIRRLVRPRDFYHIYTHTPSDTHSHIYMYTHTHTHTSELLVRLESCKFKCEQFFLYQCFSIFVPRVFKIPSLYLMLRVSGVSSSRNLDMSLSRSFSLSCKLSTCFCRMASLLLMSSYRWRRSDSCFLL